MTAWPETLAQNSLFFSLHWNSISKLQAFSPLLFSSAWTPVAVGDSFSRTGFKLSALLLKSNSLFLFHIPGCRESMMGTSRGCLAFPGVLLPTCFHIPREVQCSGWGRGSLSPPQFPDFLQLEQGVQALRSMLSSPSLEWSSPAPLELHPSCF